MTPSETADLFHKVYLDRAINRNYKEVIYYYCLKNDLSFSQAEKIISSVSLEKNNNDKTLYTSVLSDELSTLDSTSDLISYINNHSHNFSINPKSAVDILLKQKGKAFELLNNDRKILYDPENYIGADKTSDSFLYSVITDRSVTGKKGTKPISFKNAALPEEIKKSFPKPEDFSGKNSSMEEIRKAIILLFSYNYWNKANEYSLSDFYDEYIDELNLLLYKAGMSPLYYGNPYDWLFLYCTYKNDNTYHSLDIFRGILSTALDEI